MVYVLWKSQSNHTPNIQETNDWLSLNWNGLYKATPNAEWIKSQPF